MTLSIIIAGLATGAAGSLHCVGMCGPLSLALPVHHFSPAGKLAALLLYQFGRITSYSFIGLLFGLIGRRIYISGFQHWFSIGAGLLILVAAALYFLRKQTARIQLFSGFYLFIQNQIARLLSSRMSIASFGLMGIANGFLPCGMVYVALAATLSFDSIGNCVAFMSSFGAGTLPAMLAVAYAGQLFKLQWRNRFKKAVPFVMAGIGLLLILRGLDLGIPFISPELPVYPGRAVVCRP